MTVCDTDLCYCFVYLREVRVRFVLNWKVGKELKSESCSNRGCDEKSGDKRGK